MKKNIKMLIYFFNILFIGMFSITNKVYVRAENVGNTLISNIAADISAKKMLKTIERISSVPHPINSEDIQDVKLYLIECFQDLGYSDIQCQKFEYNDQNNENAIRHSSQVDLFLESTSKNAEIDGFGENIIITKPSINDTKKTLIVSAHYDSSANSSGANDNGSGVSIVLELARVLKDVDIPYNIKFIMFSGEEKFMLGSRWFAGQLSENDKDNFIGVINIDSVAEKSDLGYFAMISGKKRPDNLDYNNDNDLIKLAEINKNKISDLLTENNRFRLTMATNSDHYPFSLLDIPAVSIVQDWQEGLSVNDNTDIIENIDNERLVEVATQVLGIIFEL